MILNILLILKVWQNDGLPTQICNKCVAKLHISYQFKKQCEKSDAKLRQYLTNPPIVTQESPQQPQVPVQPQQPDNCVYIECNPLIEMGQEHRYDANIPPVSVAPDITQISYNQMPIGGYSLQTIGQVQVWIKFSFFKIIYSYL